MVVGGVILLTGILGFFTALCRNSGINCFFATPFILLSLIGVVILIVLAAIASGANGQVMKAKDEACLVDMGGQTLERMVEEQYTKLIDKNMCSAVCQCPLDVANTWEDVPMSRTRESGRVAIDLMTNEELAVVMMRGPYDAAITPLVFGTPNINNYAECY